MVAAGRQVPIQVQVTIELTGRMLPGTEIGAALAALDRPARRRHRPQLRHRPGGDGRAPPLPLPALAAIPISVQPNAGLPSVVDGADALRPHPRAARRPSRALRHRARRERRRRVLRHDARPPAAVVERCRDLVPARRTPAARARRRRRSTATCRSTRTRRSSSSVSGPTPTDRRSSARRCSAGDWDTTVAMARDQVQGGRPRARRVRRLHRGRRRRRHDGGGEPVRHPGDRCR